MWVKQPREKVVDVRLLERHFDVAIEAPAALIAVQGGTHAGQIDAPHPLDKEQVLLRIGLHRDAGLRQVE